MVRESRVRPYRPGRDKDSRRSSNHQSRRNIVVGMEKWVNHIFLEMATGLPRHDTKGFVAYV
jgi:hypothetical protein